MEATDRRKKQFEADQKARRRGGWTIQWTTPYHELPRWMQEERDREIAASFDTEKELAQAIATRKAAGLD